MEKRTPEIEQLLLDVEEKFGARPRTPADQNELILAIQKVTNESLGLSTIQRLWGYVNNVDKPRRATLNVLARYLEYRDWDEYLDALNEKAKSNANHILDGAIRARDLGIGRLVGVQIGVVKYVFRYLGKMRFEVVETKHSMLKPGDTFITTFFMVGRPLYLDDWRSEGEESKVYAAGGGAGVKKVFLLNEHLSLPQEDDSTNMNALHYNHI